MDGYQFIDVLQFLSFTTIQLDITRMEEVSDLFFKFRLEKDGVNGIDNGGNMSTYLYPLYLLIPLPI